MQTDTDEMAESIDGVLKSPYLFRSNISGLQTNKRDDDDDVDKAVEKKYFEITKRSSAIYPLKMNYPFVLATARVSTPGLTISIFCQVSVVQALNLTARDANGKREFCRFVWQQNTYAIADMKVKHFYLFFQ